MQLHQVGVQILHVLELAPAVLAHGHDVAHILVGTDDGHPYIGLLRVLDDRGVRVVVGIVHLHHGAVGFVYMIDDAGQGGHQVQVELPLQPLLDDLHMQHPQKAAPEAEAQGHGAFRLEGQGGVVELKLFQGVPQVGVLAAVLGVNAAVDHGLGGPVAGQRLGGGVFGVGDGVAHLGVLDIFDGGGEIAHLTGLEGVRRLVAQGLEISALQNGILASGGHHAHRLPPADGALLDAEQHHHAYIGVVLTVEDQSLEGGVGVAVGGGDIVHHVLQHRLHVQAQLGGNFRRVHGGQADDVLHLLLGLHGVGGGQVDLVEYRQNLQVVLHGKIGVGQSLGLHPLGGVHHQHRPLAGGQGPGHLIVEVHMARGVDEVQGVDLAVLGLVEQVHGPGLDGDAPLPLQVHVVQNLVLHLPLRHGVAQLQQPVRQRGLAMVDVGDDGKIANMGLFKHVWFPPWGDVSDVHRLLYRISRQNAIPVAAGKKKCYNKGTPIFERKGRTP